MTYTTLKGRFYNSTVILNKLNQKHFLGILSANIPHFQKTRNVKSLIEECHVMLKTTFMLSNKGNSF